MASDLEYEYEFWIDVYSPKTIPMKRLGEYMAQLGRMLGYDDNVHFRKLVGGSTALRYAVKHEAITKIDDRLEQIRHAEAANDAMAARDQINEMLRLDGAVGEIRPVRDGKAHQAKLRFAGRDIPKPEKVGPFSEPATITGELVRLEGGDATKHAGIMDSQGRTWSGDMNREMAIEMRQYLFELVVVSGDARWIRNETGVWELIAFHIKSCKPLGKETLEEDISALRGIPGSQWRDVDADEFVREQRRDDDEIH
jgi:hypothetical protein